MNFGIDTEGPSPFGKWRWRRMIRSESGNGSGRSRTRSITEKIAVFAPMPSASARMATMAKPGLLISVRNEWRMSAAGFHMNPYTDSGGQAFHPSNLQDIIAPRDDRIK